MPFSCKAEILENQIREIPLIFDSWVENSWDRYVEAGTVFAIAHDINGKCLIRLTGPGFLSTKPNLTAGDELLVGMIVAYFNANGEDIPYGQPYCTLDYH